MKTIIHCNIPTKTRSKTFLFFILFFLGFAFNTAFGQTAIISTGDEWEYYDDSRMLPNDWFLYKDTNEWKKGITPIGYGDSLVKTTINYGDDPANKDIAKYFRKSFVLENPHDYLTYMLNVQRDDGVVIYLNGKEVMRNNMPYGVIAGDTKASSLIFASENEAMVHTQILSPADFVSGINIISASVHQARGISSDCIFNLELTGSNDSKTIPALLKEQTITNLNLQLEMREHNHAQELENQKLQLSFLERTKDSYKIAAFVLLGILIFTIFLSFYLWRHFTNKEKLLMLELNQYKANDEAKDKQIMDTSLQALNDTQYIKEIKKKLEKYTDKEISQTQKAIKIIIKEIDFKLEQVD
ncbi:MAG: hypothetical protein ACK5NB_05675 [Flavobacteriaceae bacterium]